MKVKSYHFHYERKKSTDDQLIALYTGMLYPRMIEEKMLKLLRQGKVSKWFSGIGQEAISVGISMALEPEDMIFPLHRNLGVFTSRLVPLHRLVAQWQGKKNGFTKGRDRSFHFGTLEHRIVGMISHLGPQLSLAVGAALAYKLENKHSIAVAFSGEGGTSEGEFHEALNLAAVWKLPVLFVIENNAYALSTPVKEQFACENLTDKGPGYGMESIQLDGNNILEIYHTVSKWAKKTRKHPQPLLLECKTFRMRGHEEASGTKYVPDDLTKSWSLKDPLVNFENYLLEEGVITSEWMDQTKNQFLKHITEAVDQAFQEADAESEAGIETGDVFAPAVAWATAPVEVGNRVIRYVDAIREALIQAMELDQRLILMGQDIAEYGGVFKVTDGLMTRFGSDRVRNTPLCESAVIGAGVGLSLVGFRAMVEMQFSDFVTCGFNQIVNNLAKMHYRWGHAPKVLIRMPTGANVGAGPFHSQSTEAWFAHVPGLKIIYPSNAYDAKGLLLSGLRDNNPVLYFEHKYLYRTNESTVPEEPYYVPLGEASLLKEGNQATIVTYGLGVQWAVTAIEELNADVDLIDLRTLSPLDWETIKKSVTKTGRVLILHEDTLTGGIGAEIAALVGEKLFEYLDAPVMRCASLDTPVPFAKSLESLFLPAERIKSSLEKLLGY